MVAEPTAFAARGTTAEVEQGLVFQPLFNADGLIPAIVSDAQSGDVLMFAWMNPTALQLLWSPGLPPLGRPPPRRLWKKGKESGNVRRVSKFPPAGAQAAFWLKGVLAPASAACHTGNRSCFYRVLTPADPGGGGV